MPDITDHDIILEMRGDIKALQADVKEMKDNMRAQIADHENRLRFLERWVWGAIAVLAVIEIALQVYSNLKK